MSDRPYTLLSCGVSMDGYLDAGTGRRLMLSNEADFDRVDAVRATCDAILVGATTVRHDNPRLLVRSSARRRDRVARGLPPSPVKVTVTNHAALDVHADFFTAGDVEKLLYCAGEVVGPAGDRFGSVATVVDAGPQPTMRRLAEDLHARGVRRLMVEGGGSVLTQFLADDLVDELQLVVAPLFVGDPAARRFVGDARFPWTSTHRAVLAGTRQIGDVALLRYALSARCRAD